MGTSGRTFDPRNPVRRAEASERRPADVAHPLQSLQAAAGNAAVASLVSAPAECADCGQALSRAPMGIHRGIVDAVADALDMRPDEARLDAQEDYEDAVQEKKEWIGEGVRGPKDVRAPTGIGGFGAQYDPVLNVLTITLSGGVTFTDGLSIDSSGTVTANQPSGAAATAATRIMAAPPEQRAALVAPFQWATDPGSKASFLTGFQSTVENAWKEKFAFRCSKPYWDDLGAIVDVVVAIHEGPKAANEHMSLTTYKVPDTFMGPIGVVNSGPGGATDNRMTINSTDIAPRKDNLLKPSAITFRPGETALDSNARGQVKNTALVFQAANPECKTCGRAVPGVNGPVLQILCQGELNVSMMSEEEENEERERIARERYLSIVFALIDEGFVNAADRVTMIIAPTIGATCQITAENGVAQVIAEHESGHMFGLGDEYATAKGGLSGTGPAAGGATKHDQLAKDMGLEGAVAENTDNIMSIGGVVRPQHYVTFFWALKEITGMEEWMLGEPRLVSPPGGGKPSSGMGDFPVPSGGSGMA